MTPTAVVPCSPQHVANAVQSMGLRMLQLVEFGSLGPAAIGFRMMAFCEKIGKSHQWEILRKVRTGDLASKWSSQRKKRTVLSCSRLLFPLFQWGRSGSVISRNLPIPGLHIADGNGAETNSPKLQGSRAAWVSIISSITSWKSNHSKISSPTENTDISWIFMIFHGWNPKNRKILGCLPSINWWFRFRWPIHSTSLYCVQLPYWGKKLLEETLANLAVLLRPPSQRSRRTPRRCRPRHVLTRVAADQDGPSKRGKSHCSSNGIPKSPWFSMDISGGSPKSSGFFSNDVLHQNSQLASPACFDKPNERKNASSYTLFGSCWYR